MSRNPPRARRGRKLCPLFEHGCRRGCEVGIRSANERWWSQTGSNRRPEACKATALPAELWPLVRGLPRNGVTPWILLRPPEMVGLGRFELPTSRLSSARSNQLSYKPDAGADACGHPKRRLKACIHVKKEKRRRRCPALSLKSERIPPLTHDPSRVSILPPKRKDKRSSSLERR